MFYTVQPGDTPYLIAIRLNLDPKALVLMNPQKPWNVYGGDLSFRTLYVGEQLVVPDGASGMMGARTKQTSLGGIRHPNRRGLGAGPADIDSLRAQLSDARTWQENARNAPDDDTKKAHYQTAISKGALTTDGAARIAADAAAQIGPDDVTANANANTAKSLAGSNLNSQLYVAQNFAGLSVGDLSSAASDVIQKAASAVDLAASNVTALEELPPPEEAPAPAPRPAPKPPVVVVTPPTPAPTPAPASPVVVVTPASSSSVLPWVIGAVAVAAGVGLVVMQQKHGKRSGAIQLGSGGHHGHRMLTA